MKRITLSFVGWDMSFDNPFCCSSGGHSNARDTMRFILDDYECTSDERLNFVCGFIAYDDETNKISIVDRKTAHDIAKESNQLQSGYINSYELESYMLDYAPMPVDLSMKISDMCDASFNKLKRRVW